MSMDTFDRLRREYVESGGELLSWDEIDKRGETLESSTNTSTRGDMNMDTNYEDPKSLPESVEESNEALRAEYADISNRFGAVKLQMTFDLAAGIAEVLSKTGRDASSEGRRVDFDFGERTFALAVIIDGTGNHVDLFWRAPRIDHMLRFPGEMPEGVLVEKAAKRIDGILEGRELIQLDCAASPGRPPHMTLSEHIDRGSL